LPGFQRFSQEHSSPSSRLVFHRANSLVNIKALLVLPQKVGCVDPHLIGDAALLMNEFMAGHQFRQEETRPDDLDLVVEFAASWELYNPVEIGHGISRVALMIQELCSVDEGIEQQRLALGIDPATITFDGLSLSTYQAVIFGLFAHVNAASAQVVLGNPGACGFDRLEFLREVELPQDHLDTFLRHRSLSVNDLRRKINPEGLESDTDLLQRMLEDQTFTNDFTVFRQYPVVNLTGDKHFILDYYFLAELLIYGLYWHIFDSLPGNLREDFSSLWGQLFERYVSNLLCNFYGGESHLSPLRTNLPYDRGEIDAVLDFGSDVVLFECKASLLSRAAKYNRDRGLFEREIYEKFVQSPRGSPKALRQLARAVSSALNGRLPVNGGSNFYPVLIAYEPILESFGINEYLDRLFQSELREANRRVWPLTVLSIDELEEILPYFAANDWSWPAFLLDRFGDHRRVPGYSVHQSLHNFRSQNGIPRRVNKFVMRKFDEVYTAMLREYRGVH
jgi:hypothetical protein